MRSPSPCPQLSCSRLLLNAGDGLQLSRKYFGIKNKKISSLSISTIIIYHYFSFFPSTFNLLLWISSAVKRNMRCLSRCRRRCRRHHRHRCRSLPKCSCDYCCLLCCDVIHSIHLLLLAPAVNSFSDVFQFERNDSIQHSAIHVWTNRTSIHVIGMEHISEFRTYHIRYGILIYF